MLFESIKQTIDSKIKKAKKYKVSILNYPSSFGEIKALHNLKENYLPHTYEHIKSGRKNMYQQAYHPLHAADDINPQGLTDDHADAIMAYTDSDKTPAHSSVMNHYLRKKAGVPVDRMHHDFKETEIHSAINRLSSMFTPENTIKTGITTYSGIPAAIGKTFMKAGKGSEHVLPGFTSTSTHKETGISFGRFHAPLGDKHIHVMKLDLKPGTGVSLATNSLSPENEILLHHGAHITYHGTTTEHGPNGEIHHIHHVTVHK